MAETNPVIEMEIQNDRPTIGMTIERSSSTGNIIDDTAGAGVTNKAWSADKNTQELAGKADKADTVLTTTLSRGRKANTNVGLGSFAFGANVTASDMLSYAEGNRTTASGMNSHAEGSNSTASGTTSHAEGLRTTSSGEYSHAEGDMAIASGYTSHAEGSYTNASEYYAHAEGSSTTASGLGSHAQGVGTIANHKGQHSFGEYNIADNSSAAGTERGNYVEIVGNGTAINARSNIRTLDWSGNEWIAGNMTAAGGSLTIGNTTITESQLIALLALLN